MTEPIFLYEIEEHRKTVLSLRPNRSSFELVEIRKEVQWSSTSFSSVVDTSSRLSGTQPDVQ